MKKQGLAILAAGLIPAAGWAFQAEVVAGPKSGKGVPFAVQGSLGLVDGMAYEHVYDYDTGSRRQLSRLDWEIKNVVMGGINGSVRPLGKLSINTGVWLALTEGNGKMEDYDWLDYESSDWTHYSQSEVDVTEGYILDLNATWDVWADRDFTVRAMAGYKQTGWTWEDQGGFILYPEYGYVPQSFPGSEGIDYEQEFRIPYLGASGDWKSGKFTVSGYLIVSPIVFAEDWDHHKARTLKFHEEFAGGDMVGLGLEGRYAFAKVFFATVALDYQMVDLIIGDMEYEDYSTGEIGSEEEIAGIENETVIISLGIGANF